MKWILKDSVIGFDAFDHVDPYADWSFGPVQKAAAAAAGKVTTPSAPADSWEPRYPVLLRLAKGVRIQDFATGKIFARDAPPNNWKNAVVVPEVYLQNPKVDAQEYFTILALREFLLFFKKTSNDYKTVGKVLMQNIERLAVSRQLLQGTEAFQFRGTSTKPPPDFNELKEAGTVVTGVIDDGLPFAHERYRTAAGKTRIESVWLQDGPANKEAQRFGYGRVLTKSVIDKAFATSTYAGLIDEDEVYRKTDALNFGPRRNGIANRTLSLRAAHGAHVMDLACGYKPGQSPKSNNADDKDSRPIVAVQLPEATSEGTSGASLDTQVVDAVRFILDQADQIALDRKCDRLPVVINLSHGNIAGRHDGTSDLERALDEIIEQRAAVGQPVQIVIAGGNHRLSMCRASISFAGGTSNTATEKQIINWRVPPDSRAPAHLEIWLPEGNPSPSRIKVSVTPPAGPQSPSFDENKDEVYVLRDANDNGLAELRYSFMHMPTNRGVFIVTLKPSEPVEDSVTGNLDANVAPSGLWKIEIENLRLGASATVEVAIQRNDTRFGYFTFGRQSHFESATYVDTPENGVVPKSDDLTCEVKRSGTLNPIATGNHTIAVAGYRQNDRTIVDYSGEGPTQNPFRIGPDVAAPSDASKVHRGILAGGTRSGSVVALDGTSIAAPHVTRFIADRMAEGLAADRLTVVALAASFEADQPDTPATTQAGGGRLPVAQSDRPRRME